MADRYQRFCETLLRKGALKQASTCLEGLVAQRPSLPRLSSYLDANPGLDVLRRKHGAIGGPRMMVAHAMTLAQCAHIEPCMPYMTRVHYTIMPDDVSMGSLTSYLVDEGVRLLTRGQHFIGGHGAFAGDTYCRRAVCCMVEVCAGQGSHPGFEETCHEQGSC